MNSLSVLAIVINHCYMSANVRFIFSLALSDLLSGVSIPPAQWRLCSVASLLSGVSIPPAQWRLWFS